MNYLDGKVLRFDTALDRLIGQWPEGTCSTMLATGGGATHVVTRRGVGVPLVMLPGGGATGASWANVARRLARRNLLATDIPGDTGRSAPNGGRRRSVDELHDWLDEVLAHFEDEEVDLAGHSYGGWIALSYALARPGRIRNLALVAPTMCFASMAPRYVLHAMPLLVRPSERAARRLIGWETNGSTPDPTALDVYAAGAAQKWSGIVRPIRPRGADLRGLDVGVVKLILAESDRSQNNANCETIARRALSGLEVTTLDGTSHHNVLDQGASTIAEILAAPG